MEDERERKEDILQQSYMLTAGVGSIATFAAGNFVWKLVATIQPTAQVLALASVEIDVSGIPEGTINVALYFCFKICFQEKLAFSSGVESQFSSSIAVLTILPARLRSICLSFVTQKLMPTVSKIQNGSSSLVSAPTWVVSQLPMLVSLL